MAAKNENTDGTDVSARPSTRAAAVPVGRFLRVLVVEDSAGGAVAGGVWRAPCPRTGGTWRQRAGVQQLPADMLLTLHEGYQRAFAVGDLDILREPAPAQTAVLCKEEAWLECARRDASVSSLWVSFLTLCPASACRARRKSLDVPLTLATASTGYERIMLVHRSMRSLSSKAKAGTGGGR